jgi:hypothetical protein
LADLKRGQRAAILERNEAAMQPLIYEVRFADGRWRVQLDGTALFTFATREEAIQRADDLAIVGAAGRDLQIHVYDEAGALVSRLTSRDYSI